MPVQQIHVLSFEGPDPYSRAGGLATRVEGLTHALAEAGREVHLWFVGDPDDPAVEQRGTLHLHRWCQHISRRYPEGVYAGEGEKEEDYARALPPHLLNDVLRPALEQGKGAVVLAEEWQTARAVIALDRLLRDAGLRERVTLFWNANNTFGFEGIDWAALRSAARITTVSRYMKHRMRELGIDALAIPNGLSAEAFETVDRRAVAALRASFRDRMLITKMARWDPDKAWLAAVETAAALKRVGWRPLLVARGGQGPYGEIVLGTARRLGLRVVDRDAGPGPRGLVDALRDNEKLDVVNLRSHVAPDARRVLFRASDAVLANSSHEPFGLVGLETMAAGGIAFTGCSGEDYVMPGQNALVLETGDPREFIGLYQQLRSDPAHGHQMRELGRWTARRFAWPEVIERVLMPRVELERVRTVESAWSRRPAARSVASKPTEWRVVEGRTGLRSARLPEIAPHPAKRRASQAS
jgi:glycosyltransferase involved in cell wall biosynthesis